MHIVSQGSPAIKVSGCGTHTSFFTAASRPSVRHQVCKQWALFWVEYDQITMVTICLKCVVSRIFVWPVNWPLLVTHIVHIIHSLSTWVKNFVDCHIRRELFRTTPQNGAHPVTFQVSTPIILSYKIQVLKMTGCDITYPFC